MIPRHPVREIIIGHRNHFICHNTFCIFKPAAALGFQKQRIPRCLGAYYFGCGVCFQFKHSRFHACLGCGAFRAVSAGYFFFLEIAGRFSAVGCLWPLCKPQTFAAVVCAAAIHLSRICCLDRSNGKCTALPLERPGITLDGKY